MTSRLFAVMAGALACGAACSASVVSKPSVAAAPLTSAAVRASPPAQLTAAAMEPPAALPAPAVVAAALDKPLHGSPLIVIPAGEYWTGCDLGKDPFCRPQDGLYRKVYLSSYRIDKFEVTVEDYALCVKAGGCSAQGLQGYDDGTRSIDWKNCNWGKPGRDKHPLNCVSWKKADNYCQWAGKRLPKEAEWEKAARGTDKRRYPWGDEMISCEYAVTNQSGQDPDKGCGLNSTMPVGSKPKGASPYGVMDIVGNVWEWTADEYAPIKGEPLPDPAEEAHHVGKGGCWGSGNPWNSRISWSHHYAANYGSNVRLGFRCAADAPIDAADHAAEPSAQSPEPSAQLQPTSGAANSGALATKP